MACTIKSSVPNPLENSPLLECTSTHARNAWRQCTWPPEEERHLFFYMPESFSNSESSSVGKCKWIISAMKTAQISIIQVKDYKPRDATEKFIFPSWQRDMSGWSTRRRESSWKRGRRSSIRKCGRSVWAFMFFRWGWKLSGGLLKILQLIQKSTCD